MNIKKSVLTAMMIGMTIGVTATACEKLDLKKGKKENFCTEESTEGECTNDPGNPENCPACGMG